MLRFFERDKSHWTGNLLAAVKFGVSCGVFQATLPYLVGWLLGSAPTDKLWIVNRVSEGFVNTVLFGAIYYIALVLLDLYEETNHHNDSNC